MNYRQNILNFKLDVFFTGYPRIEVEKTPDAIYAKYYPSFGGGEEALCIEITEAEFMKYIHKIYSASLLEWKEEYVDLGVLDGTQWTITVRYASGKERKWYGSNDYPPVWKKFLKAVNALMLPDIK